MAKPHGRKPQRRRPRPDVASRATATRGHGGGAAASERRAGEDRQPSARQRRAAERARRERHRKVRNGGLVLGSLAILGAVIGLAVASSSGATAGTDTRPQGFVLPRLGSAGKVRLASYRGTPVVVNFFASWCSECASELPTFAQAARTLRGTVDFVEVNALETGNGGAFAQQFHLQSSVTAVASDVGGSQGDGLYQALGGSGSMPMTAFYSAAGRLLTTHVGAFDASALSSELQQLYGITPH